MGEVRDKGSGVRTMKKAVVFRQVGKRTGFITAFKDGEKENVIIKNKNDIKEENVL